MSKSKKTRSRVGCTTESSGNVFADMGLPNSEQEPIKAQLTLHIYSLLKGSGLTQVEIGKILGVPQAQVSLLLRKRSGNSSLARLMEFLTALRPGRADYRAAYAQRAWGAFGSVGVGAGNG
jgi:predicted XRE-type DNA-binding protein